MSEKITESIRILLDEILDYAGLFPPSKLPMAEAVKNYAEYRKGEYSWMLGRFVVPAARLEEFAEEARKYISQGKNSKWHLSVLAGEDISETVRQIKDFNNNNSSEIICDALEAKASSETEIADAIKVLPPNLTTYFEIPLEENLPELISALGVHNQRAKIRTGGVTPEAFPTVNSIIRFIRTCLAANVPFKATAGLHHPLRCYKPLTYEADAPEGIMNGFLNLFLATGFARYGLKPELLEEIMRDEFEESFVFENSGVRWREDHFLNNSQLARIRRSNIISFGSCSFEEPIDDLKSLQLL